MGKEEKKEKHKIVKGDKGKRGKWVKFGNEKRGNWKRKEGSQDTLIFSGTFRPSNITQWFFPVTHGIHSIWPVIESCPAGHMHFAYNSLFEVGLYAIKAMTNPL